MKKIIFLMLFALIGWQHAQAQSFIKDGFQYTITSQNTVQVTSYNWYNFIGNSYIEIPSSVEFWSLVDGYDWIYNPDIGDYEYQYYSYYVGDGLNYTVTSIGDWAFSNASFQTLVLPNTITNIGYGAFYNNSQLTQLNLPASVTTVGDNSFANCVGLTSVSIPNSVTSIGNWSFQNCSSLTSVTCDATTPINISSSVFEGVNQGACSLTVPNDSVSAYQAANVWQNFIPINNIYPQIVPASSLNFSANDNTVNLGPTIGNFGTGDFAIEMKVKTSGSPYGHTYLLDKRSFCDRDNLLDIAITPQGSIIVQTYSNQDPFSDVTGSLIVTDNSWHHIAVTRTAGYLKIYVDGVLDATSATNAAVNFNSNYNLVLGGNTPCTPYNNNQYFNGNMDEVRFWNRSLTQTEIQTNMNCEIQTTGDGLLANYHFNQGNSNDNNGAVASLVDSSGNNNNGTLLNFALTGAHSNWSSDAGVPSGVACSNPVQYTAIPDANFESALGNLGYDDIPNDGKVPTANINTVTDLQVGWLNISDLTGINDFSSLISLKCRSNNLSTLNLNGLQNLTDINCALNHLTNITLNNLPSLTIIEADNNFVLQNIDLIGLPSLSTLVIQANALTSLDFSETPNLTGISCGHNPLATLNVQSLTNLNTLYCEVTQISTLNLVGLNALNNFFSIQNPNLTCITVSDPAAAAANPNWTKDATARYSTNCNLPSAPMVDAQSFCAGATVANLVATGTDLKWYATEMDGVILTDSTVLETNMYYVSQTVNGFESPRIGTSITVNNILGSSFANPINVNTTSFTDSNDNLSQNCHVNNIINTQGWASPETWYKVTLANCTNTLVATTCGRTEFDTVVSIVAADGSTLLNTNDDDYSCIDELLSTVSTDVSNREFVYVVVEGFDSFQGNFKLSINQVFNPTATTTFTQVSPICTGAALAALPTTSNEGIIGTWSPAINNLATTTYTFTPDAGQCASTAEMTITVYHTDAPYTVGQSLCSGATVANLYSIGTDVKWYLTPTGGTALSAETVLANGNYYGSQTLNGCESDRITTTITLNPLLKPTFKQKAPICSGTTLADLPLTSLNGITGTWSPAVNNLATTTYTFTPNAGQCGKTTTMTIVVRDPGTAGTITGGEVTVCAPGRALNSDGVPTVFTNSTTLTLNGNSTGSTIQWQRSFNFENATNATPAWSTVAANAASTNDVLINGNTMTVSNVTNTVWYRAKVSYGSCATYTNTTKITVTPMAKAGVISSATSVCSGGSITFTSSAYKGSSIGWEVSTTSASAGFSTVAGENGLTYTMYNAPSTTFYVRAIVTSGDCSIVRSAAKTVGVKPTAVAGTITGGGTFCSGSNKILKIAGCLGTIQWMYSTDGSNFMNVPTGSAIAPTFSTVSSSSAASSYVVNNITGTTYFKAVVKSGLCSSAETNVVVFNTATTATATSLSVESAQVCSGAVTSLYVPLNVGDLKFQKSYNWSSATPTWTTVNLKMTSTLYSGVYGVFSTGTLTQSTAYRVVSSIGNCAPVAYSDMAVIFVMDCAPVREVEAEVAITTPFEVIAYPNPSNNVFNFKVNGANDETVSILVFDMTGRQIENKVVKANNVENLALGQNYSSGVYNVIVSQGMNTKTVRLVKK